MATSNDGVTVIEDGEILIEKDVPIPLADGHRIYCNVFRPNRNGLIPPIVVFTPYGKDSDVAVDFKRYWDFVLRDHPEVVRDGSTGKYLTWEVPDPSDGRRGVMQSSWSMRPARANRRVFTKRCRSCRRESTITPSNGPESNPGRTAGWDCSEFPAD